MIPRSAGIERNHCAERTRQCRFEGPHPENGTHANIADIAATEKLTSPTSDAFCGESTAADIVEAILDGRQLAAVTLEVLLPFQSKWLH